MDRETLRELMGPWPNSVQQPIPLFEDVTGADSVTLCRYDVYTEQGTYEVAYLQTGYSAHDYIILDWRLR